MEINFDGGEPKYSSISEINKLKKDLIPENFQTIEKKNINTYSNKKEENINELIKENNIKDFNKENHENILKNKNEEIEKLEEKKEEEEKIIEKEEKQLDLNDYKQDSNKNENEFNSEKGENKNKSEKEQENSIEVKIEEEPPNFEVEKEREEKIENLIPFWYKCLNKDHGFKYITLDRKKKSLICKNCYTSGALETNLELNQEFIDNYLKEQEQKNLSQQTPVDVIKETIEENLVSETEENPNKSKKSIKSKITEELESEKSSFLIKCLTFQCENYPYYFCESCEDFICYHCIMKRMDEKTDKSRHYFHDIESINYESNSFKDDIQLELNTINKIDVPLDYLFQNEKQRTEKIIKKLKTEDKNELVNYLNNITKNIKSLYYENSKSLYDKYIQNVFNNTDNNIKDLAISSNKTKLNIEKQLEELKTIKELINKNGLTNEEKCDLYHKNIEIIKNANSLISKGNSIILQTTEELNHINDENTKKMIEGKESLIQSILLDKEKSIIHSLTSKTKKKGTYKLNRFVTYKHEGLRFFEKTSLEFISKKDIVLCGLFLCGKYLSSKKLKKIDYSNISKEEMKFYNINIKIFEKNKKESLIDENKKLYEIVDIDDPVISIIFEKEIKLQKDIRYIIDVKNLENEKNCDIWFGNVHKKLINNNVQKIICNNTGNVFEFYMPQELNSNFNEFEFGLIEGILYGN